MRRRLALGVGAVWIMVASCSGSSGTACGQVEPCGGDVVGSWSIVGSCLSPAGMFSTDRDALFGQSEAMTAALRQAGVQHEFHSMDGAPHGFMQLPFHWSYLAGQITVREFLRKHISPGSARGPVA